MDVLERGIMLIKKLIGKEVIGSHGDKIGKVSDLDIDILSAKVNYVVIQAGFNKKYKTKLEDIITVGDTVILRLTEADLKKTSS